MLYFKNHPIKFDIIIIRYIKCQINGKIQNQFIKIYKYIYQF